MNPFPVVVLVLAVLAGAVFGPTPAVADGHLERADSFFEGLKLLDSASAADVVAAESMLREAIASGDASAETLCTLAMLRLRQGEARDAIELLERRSSSLNQDALAATQGLALRIDLCASLMTDDGPRAIAAFRNCVRHVVAAQADPVDLRYSAITVGVVVAMLEGHLAESKIPLRDLQIGRDCMLDSRVSGVGTAYASAYAEAHERAEELERQFEEIAARGIDAVAAENQARLAELDRSVDALSAQKELTSEIFRNARELTQQNTRDRRKLESQIAAIDMKLRQATPGHPGPQRPAPPPPPPRVSIQVEEIETRTQWETILRDGQLVPILVTRQFRRPQADIERDRDRQYERVLSDYQRIRDEYDRYAENHRQALESWTQADRSRRQALNEQRAAAETRRAELAAETDALKQQRRETAQQTSKLRNQKDQEAFEVELQSLALAAAGQQQIASAFRPPHFAVLSTTQEKALLQRNLRH